MPRLDREVTLKLIDVEYGISAATARGERPPNGIRRLAEATGIPRRTLSGIVYRGDQAAQYRIVLIADALGVKPKVLVAADDEEEANPDPEPEPKRETIAPPKRKNGGGTGPKRLKGAAA